MDKALQGVADNIAKTLIKEIVGDGQAASQLRKNIVDGEEVVRAPYQDMVDRLGNMVGAEVAAWIEKVNEDTGTEVQAVLDRLLEVEKKLEKLCSELDSVSDKEGGASLPNLKYAKSKYHNVESLLNYVEQGEDRGGLKLVIMNFND